MKKLILLVVTAIVIAAVVFFGVKLIKATPKAEAEQNNVYVTTSVTPEPVSTATPTATPKPATPTATPTPVSSATPAPTTATQTVEDATASEANPSDEAEDFIESIRTAGTHAEKVPSQAREEKAGYVKSVKLDDPALTKWTARDLVLGEEPAWMLPTRAGKPIVAGWAYQTRRVATVIDVVPDWYCAEHKAAKLSCETTTEDYTLYKGDVASEALRAFRLVRLEGGDFEWRLALCECGITEKISGGPGGSSPTKKPTPPPTTPTPPPTGPAHSGQQTLPPKQNDSNPNHSGQQTPPPKQNDSNPDHSGQQTLPPSQTDSNSNQNSNQSSTPNHSGSTLPPKQNGGSDAPPMGGETW